MQAVQPLLGAGEKKPALKKKSGLRQKKQLHPNDGPVAKIQLLRINRTSLPPHPNAREGNKRIYFERKFFIILGDCSTAMHRKLVSYETLGAITFPRTFLLNVLTCQVVG